MCLEFLWLPQVICGVCLQIANCFLSLPTSTCCVPLFLFYFPVEKCNFINCYVFTWLSCSAQLHASLLKTACDACLSFCKFTTSTCLNLPCHTVSLFYSSYLMMSVWCLIRSSYLEVQQQLLLFWEWPCIAGWLCTTESSATGARTACLHARRSSTFTVPSFKDDYEYSSTKYGTATTSVQHEYDASPTWPISIIKSKRCESLRLHIFICSKFQYLMVSSYLTRPTHAASS